MSSDSSSEISLVREIIRVLDEKKAVDLRVLRVSEQSTITDFLVLATGTSEPHLRALRIELEKVLDSRKARIAGMDTGEPGSGWTVVDAYQVMIHLFTREKRDEYRLENLWKDAEELSLSRLLNPDAESAKPARAGAKPRTKKKTTSIKSTRRPAAMKPPKAAKSAAGTKAKKKAVPTKPMSRKTGRQR